MESNIDVLCRWMACGALRAARGDGCELPRNADGDVVGCSLLESTACQLVAALERLALA
jgi:hypothetical protein